MCIISYSIAVSIHEKLSELTGLNVPPDSSQIISDWGPFRQSIA